MKELLHKPRFPRWVIVSICLLSAAVIGGGYWSYQHQEDRTRENAQELLMSVATFKVDQLAQWRDDTLSDAAVIARNPFAVEFFAKWRETGETADEVRILSWLQSIRDAREYQSVELVDPDGAILIGDTDSEAVISADEVSAVVTAISTDTPVLTDLHFTDSGNICIDTIAPLYSGTAGSRKASGAIILHTYADEYLYPLIQSWPTPSKTAETILVRREGDNVLFLNELRFRSGSALKLTMPLTDTDLPAVMAVEGKSGPVESLDYREVRVVAVIQPVPDSPWFVITKMDSSEVFAATFLDSALILSLIGMLVLIIAVGALLVWQWGLKGHYQAAYASESARRALLERFEHLVRQAADIVLLADENRRLVEANDLALEEYGYSRNELTALHTFDLMTPETAAEARIHAAEATSAISLLREAVHKRKDGSVFPVEVSERAVSVEGRIYYQAVVRNISERRRAEDERLENEERLRQAQKMEAVGQLAGGIAHDFNNLLTAILGYCDLIALQEGFTDSVAAEDLHEIRRAAERAATLTKQILAFSRRQPLQARVVSLNDILKSIEPLLRRTLGENIDLVTLEQPELGNAELDTHQFEQVCINLALNARAAMPKGGRLTLETGNVELDQEYCRNHTEASPGPHVMMAISDTGTGMDEATLAHIFEPFYTTKGPGEGTGLGLSMVHGVVSQSGGSISVYSELGKGTTFKIYLPRVDAANLESVAFRPERLINSGSEAVAIVEDEPSLRSLMTRVLGDMGYKVTAYASADEAVAFLEQDLSFDLLITDVVLPGTLQGNDLANRLQSSRPTLPVLYISGYTRNAIVHAGRLDKGVNFLEKPFTPEALLRTVRQLLDQKRGAGHSKRK
jgi:PAS domain S-box-containing protein